MHHVNAADGQSALPPVVTPEEWQRAPDTSFVLTSIAPLAELEAFKMRMGWTVPWYSCRDRRVNDDCGTVRGFGLSVDRSRFDLNVLDHTPFGRQEDWEDSPAGWPQTPAYLWRLHDEYPPEDHRVPA